MLCEIPLVEAPTLSKIIYQRGALQIQCANRDSAGQLLKDSELVAGVPIGKEQLKDGTLRTSNPA